MSDIKVGGYGEGGCTCAIQATGSCPVHGRCADCGKPLGHGQLAYGPDGPIHYRCFKLSTAHGRIVPTPPELLDE